MGKCVRSLLSEDLSLFCVAVTEYHRPDHVQQPEFAMSFWKLKSPRSRNSFGRSFSYATTWQRALHGCVYREPAHQTTDPFFAIAADPFILLSQSRDLWVGSASEHCCVRGIFPLYKSWRTQVAIAESLSRVLEMGIREYILFAGLAKLVFKAVLPISVSNIHPGKHFTPHPHYYFEVAITWISLNHWFTAMLSFTNYFLVIYFLNVPFSCNLLLFFKVHSWYPLKYLMFGIF